MLFLIHNINFILYYQKKRYKNSFALFIYLLNFSYILCFINCCLLSLGSLLDGLFHFLFFNLIFLILLGLCLVIYKLLFFLFLCLSLIVWLLYFYLFILFSWVYIMLEHLLSFRIPRSNISFKSALFSTAHAFASI